MKIIFYNAGIA